ncbi:MAG: hypothetical protein QW035_01215 [Candidatus Anstonellales archaeon]
MGFKEAFAHKGIMEHSLRPFLGENSELFIYIVIAAMLPVAVGNQLVVGTAVNALLILSALHFRGWKPLLLIFFPSIFAFLFSSILLGETHFLAYLLPPIWVGNAIIVVAFKVFVAENKGYWETLLKAALLKAGVIGASALALIWAGFVPAAMLLPMSALQFVTAMLGGISAYALRSAILGWK